MRYLPLFVIISIVIFSTLNFPVFSEDFDFNRAYQDYLYTYGEYRDAHEEYNTARRQYLSYKTLTSKSLAHQKTLNMLQKRDEVIRTYLIAIKMKMAETTGIINYKQNVIYLALDDEISWYESHREKLTSAATLEDLIKTSQEAENRYPKTKILIYKALGTILEGKENNFKNQIEEQIGLIKQKINQIHEKEDKNTATAERWLLEAENKITRSQEKINAAMAILDSLKVSSSEMDHFYNRSRELVQESHLYLKEANSHLRELIKELKTAD